MKTTIHMVTRKVTISIKNITTGRTAGNGFYLKALTLSLLLPLMVASCDRGSDSAAHEHGVDAEHGGHGHDADAAMVYSHYSDVTELFVEFPPLVVNQPSPFAAHVTRLEDFQPLTSGTMDVLLRRDEQTLARFRVREPARAGVFTPTVTAKEAGEFQLVIEIRSDASVGQRSGDSGARSGDFYARHDLGTVRVSAQDDARTVHIDQPQPEGDIRYSKEQQWDNPFATALVRMRPLRSSVAGFGTVKAPGDASATIRAPADGYYTAATARFAGESLSADAVLGHLIPRLGEGTDIGRLLVELERARSELTLAKRDVERLQSLLDQGAISERELEVAQHTLDVARAELDSAQSRVTQQTGTSSDQGIALRSPIAGELVAVQVQPGAFVKAGDSLFTVVEPSRRWLEVRVPEKFSEGLRNTTGAWLDTNNNRTENVPKTLVLNAHQRGEKGEITGVRIVQIDTLIDPHSRTAAVTVEYPSAIGPNAIGARYPAHVFVGEAKSRLAIPRSAIIDDGGRPVVYVQSNGETFARRAVRLGIVDGDYVEVAEGVEADERVVSRGAYYIKLAAAGGDEIGHGHAH